MKLTLKGTIFNEYRLKKVRGYSDLKQKIPLAVYFKTRNFKFKEKTLLLSFYDSSTVALKAKHNKTNS